MTCLIIRYNPADEPFFKSLQSECWHGAVHTIKTRPVDMIGLEAFDFAYLFVKTEVVRNKVASKGFIHSVTVIPDLPFSGVI
jgi:hypothetical protein